MPSPKREYSRLYLDLVDDPMFDKVYPDDALFGLWAKLLMLAESAWPASAQLPIGVSKARLQKLSDAGLVLVTGVRFRVRGLDKERGTRSDHGRRGADGRWHRPGDDEQPGAASSVDDDGMPPHPNGTAGAMRAHPSSNAEGMPSKDEQSKAKKSRDETSTAGARGSELDGIDLFRDGLPHLDEETLQLGHDLTGKPAREMGDRQLDEIDRLLGEYGADRVRAAMRKVPPHEGKVTWQRLVWGARKVIEPLWEGRPSIPDDEYAERRRQEMAEQTARVIEERTSVKEPDEAEVRAGLDQLAAAVGRRSRGG